MLKRIFTVSTFLLLAGQAYEVEAMDNSQYIALSKQVAMFREMEVVANNVANANTSGYKSQGMLYAAHPVRSPSTSEHNHRLDFTKDISTYTDTSGGPLDITGNPLDVAIVGPGYFKIKTPQGFRYTRDGSFRLNGQGELVTHQGYQVLGQDSAPIVFQEEDKDVLVREDGTISVGAPEQIEKDDRGQIGVFVFANDQRLERVGGNLYAAGDMKDAPGNPDLYKVSQGSIEKSNVEPIKQITTMITLSRNVNNTSQLLTNVNDLERNAVRTISRQQ